MFFDGAQMGFGMWFFWIVLIVLAVVFIRAFSNDDSSTPRQESPLDILKARYARGEIGEEEFNRRKRTLEEG